MGSPRTLLGSPCWLDDWASVNARFSSEFPILVLPVLDVRGLCAFQAASRYSAEVVRIELLRVLREIEGLARHRHNVCDPTCIVSAFRLGLLPMLKHAATSAGGIGAWWPPTAPRTASSSSLATSSKIQTPELGAVESSCQTIRAVLGGEWSAILVDTEDAGRSTQHHCQKLLAALDHEFTGPNLGRFLPMLTVLALRQWRSALDTGPISSFAAASLQFLKLAPSLGRTKILDLECESKLSLLLEIRNQADRALQCCRLLHIEACRKNKTNKRDYLDCEDIPATNAMVGIGNSVPSGVDLRSLSCLRLHAHLLPEMSTMARVIRDVCHELSFALPIISDISGLGIKQRRWDSLQKKCGIRLPPLSEATLGICMASGITRYVAEIAEWAEEVIHSRTLRKARQLKRNMLGKSSVLCRIVGTGPPEASTLLSQTC